MNSVLAAVDAFYAEVVQHIKPWAPAPPKVKDDEATPSVSSPIDDGPRAEPSANDEDGYREEHAGLIPGRSLPQLLEAKTPLGHPSAYPGENCTVIELRRPAGRPPYSAAGIPSPRKLSAAPADAYGSRTSNGTSGATTGR